MPPANVWIFGVFIDEQFVSSIRLRVTGCGCSTLAAVNVFPDLPTPQIRAGKKIIDPTRFVVDRTQSRKHPVLCYATIRLAWLASEYFDADLLLASVRTEHQAYYRRVFGHWRICEARHYPSLVKPIAVMSLEYPAAKAIKQRRYSFFRSTHFDRPMLFERNVGMPMRTAA
jgi:hypothetical protein